MVFSLERSVIDTAMFNVVFEAGKPMICYTNVLGEYNIYETKKITNLVLSQVLDRNGKSSKSFSDCN